MNTKFVCAVSLAALACAANPSPVPMAGTAEDLRGLVGEWNGEYKSSEAGRTGSISFTLAAGHDTAFGDVVMVPTEPNHPMPVEAPLPSHPAQPMAQVLTIRFVRVTGRLVSGTIAPYPAPGCECTLATTFRGELRGDRIAGDFVIVHSDPDHAPQRGTWWVKRMPNATPAFRKPPTL